MDDLYSSIRALGYTTSGQTSEIVEFVEQHLRVQRDQVLAEAAKLMRPMLRSMISRGDAYDLIMGLKSKGESNG